MGTAGTTLSYPRNAVMKSTKKKSIPDRTRPGSTTSARIAGNSQGESAPHLCVKTTTGDQSQKIEMLKQGIVIGTWNVRTLHATGKLKELTHELQRYRWNILGLAEVRWPGVGEMVTDEGHKLWYMGEERKSERGVAFLVHKDIKGSVMECRPISSRLISIRIAAKPMNITVIQVYAPTTASSEDEIEDFYHELGSVIDNSPKKDVLIVQGDWNAKVGIDAYQDYAGTVGKFGWGVTNDRGTRMLEFARFHNLSIANTLHCHKPSRRTTWHSPNGKDHNQIDFILVSRRFVSGVNAAKTRTFPGADIGSDHDMVLMTLKTRLKKYQNNNNPRVRYDLRKLDDPNIREQFQAKLGGRFAPLLLLQNITEIEEGFTKEMNAVAEEILGQKRYVKRPWITDEALRLCDRRRELKKRRFDGVDQQGINHTLEYKVANANIRKELRAAKGSWINSQCQAIEENLRHTNTKQAFAIVKNLTRNRQSRTAVINDKNGRMITEAKAVAERWREYCHDLYSHPLNVDTDIMKRPQEVEEQEERLPILREEVVTAIKQLKAGKAAGIDNIPGELLREGGESTVSILLKICNEVWISGKWPPSWTTSIIVPIPKKGDLKECQNYRTISLISHPSKVLLKVILNRLRPQIEPLLADEQAGFRAGRSTVEQILNLRLLCEKYADHSRELHHNFIDFTKAFDRVWQEGLWAIMRRHGISKEIIECIKSAYDSSECTVMYGNLLSDKFHPQLGVRQGCPLSPCLFNLFLEEVMAEALEGFEGTISIGGRNISNLRFADDIDLLAGSNQELADLTACLDKAAVRYGMEISVSKSKILAMGVKSTQPDIYIRGNKLETVQSFKYLGATITEDARCVTEIKTRIAIATGALAKLEILWKDKSIALTSKVRLLRAITLSTALYGCESWTLTAEMERRLQAFEFRCYRKILRIPYTAHRTNESVWAEITEKGGPQEHLLVTIKRRKMRWFGHVNRSNGLAKLIMQGSVEGRRSRGRPRMSWLDNIRVWTGKTTEEIHCLSKNRKAWKHISFMSASYTATPRSTRSRDR